MEGNGERMSIKVRLVQLGRGVIDCEVAAGSTVHGVLSSNGVPLEGMEVRVNGSGAELGRALSEGDLITVVPLIKGGSVVRQVLASGVGDLRPWTGFGSPNARL